LFDDCYSYTYLFDDDCYHYTFLFDDDCHSYTFLFDNDCYSYTFCFCFQFLNVIFFTLEVIYLFIPSIWIIFAAVLWEGLLGGAAYVNTFYKMSVEVSGFLYWKYLASVLLHTALIITSYICYWEVFQQCSFWVPQSFSVLPHVLSFTQPRNAWHILLYVCV
jgi:hypothetical protein